jgi:hypothetical protein
MLAGRLRRRGKMNKELQKLIEFNNGNAYIYNDSDRIVLNELFGNIPLIEEYNRPDLIINLDSKIIAIEHFDFDASLVKGKKGSIDQETYSFRQKNHNKAVVNCESDIYMTSSLIDLEISSTNYLNNFFSNLENHYKNIPIYINRCKEKYGSKKVEMIFYIVDNSSTFLFYENNDSLKILMLFTIKEFLDRINKYNQIDYILYGFFNGVENTFAFISNTKETINRLYTEEVISINEIVLKKGSCLEQLITIKRDC